MLRKLMKDQSGYYAFTIAYTVILITLLLMITVESSRVYGLREHLEEEIERAANLALKTAMEDSWRMDGYSRMDESIAYEKFYEYVKEDLQLNGNLERYDSGQLVYRLEVQEVERNHEQANMSVRAIAYAPSLFRLWPYDWEIPIHVSSRNMRTDTN